MYVTNKYGCSWTLPCFASLIDRQPGIDPAGVHLNGQGEEEAVLVDLAHVHNLDEGLDFQPAFVG